jgi:hypothetical protein
MNYERGQEMKNVVLTVCVCTLLWTLATGNVEAKDKREWVPLGIVDVNSLPWDERFRMGSKQTTKGKLLYTNKSGAILFYTHFSPGWDAVNKDRHYHNFAEWGYVLDGDFLLYEFVSPNQKKGTLVEMRQGTWMYRPAFSIHGNRSDAMERQRVTPGSTQLLFAEGGKNYVLDPDSPMYTDDWKTVKQFYQPHYQQTATPEVMEWEEDAELPGVLVKWLYDGMAGGFRAKLRYAPPGWHHSGGPERSYYDSAQRFMYVLYGDIKILNASGPDDPGKIVVATQDFFINQPPKSIWAWGEGPLTDSGVMWLDVTYAEGTKSGGGLIEDWKILP